MLAHQEVDNVRCVDPRRIIKTWAIAVLFALIGAASDLNAQTVFPSQVTPQTLRPPAPSGDNLEVLDNSKVEPKKKKPKAPKPVKNQ